jgi:hypothetical protein
VPGQEDAVTAVARLFELHRDKDISGVSGTGVVAEGAQFVQPTIVVFPDGVRIRMPAGWCRLVWLTGHSSTVLWRSVEDAIAIHGHDGATRLVWLDEK